MGIRGSQSWAHFGQLSVANRPQEQDYPFAHKPRSLILYFWSWRHTSLFTIGVLTGVGMKIPGTLWFTGQAWWQADPQMMQNEGMSSCPRVKPWSLVKLFVVFNLRKPISSHMLIFPSTPCPWFTTHSIKSVRTQRTMHFVPLNLGQDPYLHTLERYLNPSMCRLSSYTKVHMK